MRYAFFLFLFSILCVICCAQSPDIGLQYIDHSTNITHNYSTSNINSDFGSRHINPPHSKWHKGIDLNRDNETDHGDRIISPCWRGFVIRAGTIYNNLYFYS